MKRVNSLLLLGLLFVSNLYSGNGQVSVSQQPRRPSVKVSSYSVKTMSAQEQLRANNAAKAAKEAEAMRKRSINPKAAKYQITTSPTQGSLTRSNSSSSTAPSTSEKKGNFVTNWWNKRKAKKAAAKK